MQKYVLNVRFEYILRTYVFTFRLIEVLFEIAVF